MVRSHRKRLLLAPLGIVMSVVLISLLVPTATGSPVVIQMQRSIREADRNWQEAVVQEFNREHDHIKIELAGGGEGIGYGKLQVLIIAGEAPHIIYQDPNNLPQHGTTGRSCGSEALSRLGAEQQPVQGFLRGYLVVLHPLATASTGWHSICRPKP